MRKVFCQNDMSLVTNFCMRYEEFKEYLRGICCFCKHESPSLYLSPQRNIFYCTECFTGGDIISFMARLWSCSEKSALGRIEEIFAIPIANAVRMEFTNQSEEIT